jgi:uncharacterized protein YqgC (DUF456 family)
MEWIIYDDGSDPVGDLFKDLPLPNIRYIYNGVKQKIGYKRNRLNELARGHIVVAMDDDDYYPPERVHHVVQMMRANPRYMVAGSSEIYMYYQDITDGVKLNNTENVGQKNLFAIADGSVSIASPGMNVSGTSVAKDNAISKLLAVDFVSGAALGAVIGFAISGVNPAGILIGAGVGAVVTSAVQKITEERYYIAAIGIKLATKSSHMVEGTQTLLMPQSSNMIKKVVSSFKDDWVERHTEMFVIAESFFWRSSAERQIAEIAAKSISALIY